MLPLLSGKPVSGNIGMSVGVGELSGVDSSAGGGGSVGASVGGGVVGGGVVGSAVGSSVGVGVGVKPAATGCAPGGNANPSSVVIKNNIQLNPINHFILERFIVSASSNNKGSVYIHPIHYKTKTFS